MANVIDSLRGETVVETVANIAHHFFGDEVEVPDDVIGALLVLAAEIGNATTVDTDNARMVTNSEISDMTK